MRPLVAARRRRIRIFSTLLCAGLVLGADPLGASQTARRSCDAECRAAGDMCLEQAAAQSAASARICIAEGRSKPCRETAKQSFEAAKAWCNAGAKTCRRCCKADGAACVQPIEEPHFTGSFELPQREELEDLPFPPGPGGAGFTLVPLPDGDFFIDPANRSPVSAAGECADAMLACLAPPERNVAGCFATVPVCETDTPWIGDAPMCCPAVCGARYQQLLLGGLEPALAFTKAIWGIPSCMPELDAITLEPAP